MKKLVRFLTVYMTILVSLVVAISCKEEKPEAPKHFKEFSLDVESLMISGGGFKDGVIFGSDKHEYLVIKYESHGQNIEHYIDCKLCQSRRESADDNQ